MNKFLEAVHDMIEIITGERPESPTDKDFETVRSGEDRRSVDRETSDRRAEGYTEDNSYYLQRARDEVGRYRGDDKSTPNINEAWVGGKAPKKRKK